MLWDANSHNERGLELVDRGWLFEAMREFNKAIDKKPKCADAYDNLASVYAEKGQPFKALKLYLTAIELDPKNAAAHHNLGCFLANFGNDLAIEQYKSTIKLEDDFPDVHLNYGMALAEVGEYKKAIQLFKTALDIDSSDTMARHELACVYLELGLYHKAIKQLRIVINEDKKNVNALVDLGICYTKTGFYDEANLTFKKALKIDADNFLGNYYLAALHSLQNNKEEAIKHLEIAIKQDKNQIREFIKDDSQFDSIRNSKSFIKLNIF
ncbi:tetratricopeptide repeat protein [Sulfobacillus acidophilus]|uniref:Tetratricopeptide repeat protein n=1 Tax=Sulfobacillus acidophilus TaxID=53633 RepID=A0ABS3AWY8_9FIRM|nr:tetratricopeptide repeat protein [Sulfobacillus acidophilus]